MGLQWGSVIRNHYCHDELHTKSIQITIKDTMDIYGQFKASYPPISCALQTGQIEEKEDLLHRLFRAEARRDHNDDAHGVSSRHRLPAAATHTLSPLLIIMRNLLPETP